MAPDQMLTAGYASGAKRTDWADLAANAAEPNAFYAPEMLAPALEHLGGAQVRVIEAREGGRLIGLIPLVVASRHGRLPLANVRNWMHDHCFFGAPLIRRGAEQAAWAAILAQLDVAGWAPGFLHLTGLDVDGANVAALTATCAEQRRPFREVQRYERALLCSDLTAEAYWEVNVRAKKRKELRRLRNRLDEMGAVESHILSAEADLERWCTDFLALEAAGWKGGNGTAMASRQADAAFFRQATRRAFSSGGLHFLRLDLNRRAIAMLVNFRHGRGAFSFKIAIDEELGRFSPGTLIERENLVSVQGHAAIDWMDSCAAANHSMIDSLWAERRGIAQYRVGLRGGLKRRGALALAELADNAGAWMRGRMKA